MLVSRRSAVMLLEATERVGIDPLDLLEPLGLDPDELTKSEGRVAWSTLAQICARLSVLLDDDVERLRDVGRAMTYTRAYEGVRRIARSTLSLERLYYLSTRWIGQASFPHLRVVTSFVSKSELFLYGAIPDAYAPSKPFFHISEGSFTHLPTLLGLAPAKIVESNVTPRKLELLLSLPRSPSRLRNGIAALVGFATRRMGNTTNALEEEQRLLSEGLESVKRAHREQRVLLERLPDMVVVHVQGRIVYANRAFVTTLGWSSLEELEGKPLLDFVHLRSRVVFVAHASRPEVRGSPELARATLVARDGTTRLIEVAPPQSVVFDGEDAWLVVGRDIEERVRLQEQLATADRLASLGLLAAGVAHEVNNPLAYVLNNIEIARKQLATIAPHAEASLQALTVALEGVDRIRVIVRELLLLSRNDDESVGPVDVSAVVASTLSLARPEIARTARLVTEIEAAPLATANVSRVAQIVLNLVLNAVEAMAGKDPASNVLTVRLSTTDDGHVLLEVSDTGAGIRKQDLGRIFEPFFTTKPAGKGTGLGLAITQRLVLELGGHISVTSTPRRGSTFRVVLPAADEADEPKFGPTPEAPVSASETG